MCLNGEKSGQMAFRTRAISKMRPSDGCGKDAIPLAVVQVVRFLRIWMSSGECRFKANEVRLQLHALAYNLANFLRTLVLPTAIADWSLTSLRDRMIKIGTTAVRHARSVILQLAEVAIPRDLWTEMLAIIADLKAKAQAP